MQETIKEIEVRKIHPSKLNPRLELNVERLNDLAISIREVGLLEPIIVRPLDDGYEVVVGERRYRAAQQAGLETMPAIVREYADDEVVQLNLIENVQREELSAIEKGRVCKYLLENCPEKYPSQTTIAKRIGVSDDTISLWLRAIQVIPTGVQRYVAPSTLSGDVPEGKIDYTTAVKVGRSVADPDRKAEVIRKLAEKRFPIKERNEIIKKIAAEPEKPVEQVIEEVSQAPYEMEFTANDKQPLIEGKKIQTSRIDIPDNKVKTGSLVQAVIREPRIADLRITSIERKRLRYFDEDDATREGGYTLEEFRKNWKETHGEWDEDQLVYIIHFERVK